MSTSPPVSHARFPIFDTPEIVKPWSSAKGPFTFRIFTIVFHPGWPAGSRNEASIGLEVAEIPQVFKFTGGEATPPKDQSKVLSSDDIARSFFFF